MPTTAAAPGAVFQQLNPAMTCLRGPVFALVLLGLCAPPSAAQDRPFLFSVSTPPREEPHVSMQYEAGFGEGAFDLVAGDRPEQRLGVQASLPTGVTLLARVGIALDDSDTRSSQQAEVLYSALRSQASGGSVALGLGMRHESAGVNVLLGRVVAGRRFDRWRLDSNLVFEKPFSIGRDAVDVITTVGVARGSRPASMWGSSSSAKISKASGKRKKPREAHACSSARRFVSPLPLDAGS